MKILLLNAGTGILKVKLFIADSGRASELRLPHESGLAGPTFVRPFQRGKCEWSKSPGNST